MKKKLLISAVIVNLLSTHAFGESIDSLFNPSSLPLVVSISGGAAFTKAGETQTIDLAPRTIKTFAAHKASNVLGAGEIFIGLQKMIFPQLLGQYGFAIAKTGDANLQGYIWDDANPKFDNSKYQYYIQSTSFAVKGKLILDNVRWIEPWMSASLGVSCNRAHGFSNTPVIAEAVAMDNFGGRNETSFSYTLGIGFQKPLTPNWQIGVGYEFASWGESELDRALGQTESSGPQVNHIYTQGIMINLTYLK
jgi:opacity protein-like surface antigen